MSTSYPLINGFRPSYASIEIKIKGQTYLGVKSINYSDGAEVGVVKGTSVLPIGRTAGEFSASGDMELYLDEAHILMQALSPNYGRVPFQVVIQFSEMQDSGMSLHQHTLNGCLITKAENSNASGTDASAMKFSLSIIQPIDRDGQTIVPPIPPTVLVGG